MHLAPPLTGGAFCGIIVLLGVNLQLGGGRMGIVQIVIIVFWIIMLICLILTGAWFSSKKEELDEDGYIKRLNKFLKIVAVLFVVGIISVFLYCRFPFFLEGRVVKIVETELRKSTKVTELYPIQNDDIYVLSYADSLFYLTNNGMIQVNNLYNTDFDAADEYIETYKIRKKAYLTSDTEGKWPLYVWSKSDAYQIHLKCTEEMSFLNTPK